MSNKGIGNLNEPNLYSYTEKISDTAEQTCTTDRKFLILIDLMNKEGLLKGL